MNTSHKGYTKEKACRDELVKDGWIIPFQSVRTRWATYDFGDLFDVVAYKGKMRKYISCKHLGAGNYYLQHQCEIKKFVEQYGLQSESYELWLWDKARWHGRGYKKIWVEARWVVIKITEEIAI